MHPSNQITAFLKRIEYSWHKNYIDVNGWLKLSNQCPFSPLESNHLPCLSLHTGALWTFVVLLIFSSISIPIVPLDSFGWRLCLSDPIEQILRLSSLRQNDGSVIAYQGSHGPALSEWALLMAFSTEKSISGPPSDDNNTGISSALCAMNYLDFFSTFFKSTARLWHEREEL